MDDHDTIERATRAKRGSPFLNTDQAAAYLKISSRLLRRLRVRGEGPIFRRHCRFIQYHIDDLDAWSVEHAARENAHD
ncbi:DNA-binding protein [Sphingomonas koreensis]|nr:DNA-binding protein [Sphingomonas koreensis]